MHTYVESDHAQFAAMAEYQEKYGVKVKRWSDEDLAAFEKAWLEVLAGGSAKDPLFKKIADHYLDYRKKFSVGLVADDEAHLRRQADRPARPSGRAGTLSMMTSHCRRCPAGQRTLGHTGEPSA